MDSIDLLRFFNLVFAGALAGFEIGVHYGLGPPPASLREDAQILLRQTMVLRLRVLAPAIFFPTLASAVALFIRDRSSADVWLRSVALGALGLWIVFRVVRTIPVNSATLTWQPNAPPENWRKLVEKAEKAHKLAAWAAVVAFACLVAATLRQQ
jgi:hypothetical protein